MYGVRHPQRGSVSHPYTPVPSGSNANENANSETSWQDSCKSRNDGESASAEWCRWYEGAETGETVSDWSSVLRLEATSPVYRMVPGSLLTIRCLTELHGLWSHNQFCGVWLRSWLSHHSRLSWVSQMWVYTYIYTWRSRHLCMKQYSKRWHIWCSNIQRDRRERHLDPLEQTEQELSHPFWSGWPSSSAARTSRPWATVTMCIFPPVSWAAVDGHNIQLDTGIGGEGCRMFGCCSARSGFCCRSMQRYQNKRCFLASKISRNNLRWRWFTDIKAIRRLDLSLFYAGVEQKWPLRRRYLLTEISLGLQS